jgi:poly-beta-1,6-N-acetyl-D-glucosamine synthase
MNVWYNMLLYSVWFISTYYVVLLIIVLFAGKESLYENKKFKNEHHKHVSIIVPAFNEAKKIKQTIDSLKKIRYDLLEFIIVNDGSTDNTPEVVRTAIKDDERFIFIDRKSNKGKAASLNEGIRKARGEIVATMDADSVVEPKIFQKVLPYFENQKVGAVTVSVLVKKPKTMLQKLFDIEYIIGLSLFLKVFSLFDGVFVTPGPFSIYRKSVLNELEGFDENNITEDMEIAYRIQMKKYKIAHCLEAKAYTIIPPTFKKLCVQRKRWYGGALLTLKQHRSMLLNSKYGAFGFFVFFNYLLIFFGLSLFLSSVYLTVSKFIKELLYYQYTNFNIIERLFDFNFDVLRMTRATLVGYISGILTVAILIIGLYFTKTKFKEKKLGILIYPFLFIFYQIFWLITLFSMAIGKRIKWR